MSLRPESAARPIWKPMRRVTAPTACMATSWMRGGKRRLRRTPTVLPTRTVPVLTSVPSIAAPGKTQGDTSPPQRKQLRRSSRGFGRPCQGHSGAQNPRPARAYPNIPPMRAPATRLIRARLSAATMIKMKERAAASLTEPAM